MGNTMAALGEKAVILGRQDRLSLRRRESVVAGLEQWASVMTDPNSWSRTNDPDYWK